MTPVAWSLVAPSPLTGTGCSQDPLLPACQGSAAIFNNPSHSWQAVLLPETMLQVSEGGWYLEANHVAEVGKRQMDRHAMQSEVGYLLSEVWKVREKGRKGERQRQRERGENGEVEVASLR